jgi:hypothetical protein
MGAACTSSYQATQPDWHLLGIAARQADRSSQRHNEGRQKHGSDLCVATPRTFSLSKAGILWLASRGAPGGGHRPP